MRRVARCRALLALVSCLGTGCSQGVPTDPLVEEARALDRQVLAACTKAERDDHAERRFRAHYADLRQRVRLAEGAWSARTISDAWFSLHCCGVNLQVDHMALVDELQYGIDRIRSRPTWDGMPRLLLTLTEVMHEKGSAVDLADQWFGMVEGWRDEPKKP